MSRTLLAVVLAATIAPAARSAAPAPVPAVPARPVVRAVRAAPAAPARAVPAAPVRPARGGPARPVPAVRAAPARPVSAVRAVPAFTVTRASVSPRDAFFAGAPVRIAFAIDAAAPLALRVEIVREATRRPVRRLALPAPAATGAPTQRLTWDGVTGEGEVAPNGTYRVRLTAPDGTARNAGTFMLHSHIYPIRGPHTDRGPIGAFGVGRSGGRTHQGFDVNAACGTKLVAARGGRVIRSDYDPVLYGNLVIVRGERTHRDYWYAHLERPSPLRTGDRVRTGQRIGRVGATGNARTIGCHLHFEIRRDGVPIDPAPELHAWDAWS